MAEIAVYGTVAADVVLRVPALPPPGGHVSAEPLGWRLGGSSANVACGLAGAGHHVELIGPIGSDEMADALVAELQQRRVGVERSIRVEGPAPRTLILLAPDGERTIVAIEGGTATETFPVDDPPVLEDAECVYVESYDRFSTVVAERSAGALVVAPPPSPDFPAWPADVIVGSDQQYPAHWLQSPFAAARRVAGRRLRWVVVTRGRAGADAYWGDGSAHVAARPARQVDATGAGDAFVAGLIVGLLGERGIEDAMELGARQGAAAVELLQSVPPGWLTGVELT